MKSLGRAGKQKSMRFGCFQEHGRIPGREEQVLLSVTVPTALSWCASLASEGVLERNPALADVSKLSGFQDLLLQPSGKAASSPFLPIATVDLCSTRKFILR